MRYHDFLDSDRAFYASWPRIKIYSGERALSWYALPSNGPILFPFFIVTSAMVNACVINILYSFYQPIIKCSKLFDLFISATRHSTQKDAQGYATACPKVCVMIFCCAVSGANARLRFGYRRSQGKPAVQEVKRLTRPV